MSSVKNIIVTYSAQVVSLACSFVCSILAARMLGAYGQGELTLYNNFIAFATLLIGMGLPSTLVYFIAAGKLAKEHVFGLGIWIFVFMLAFVGIFIGLQYVGYLQTFIPSFVQQNTFFVLVLIVHLVMTIFNVIFAAILQAENKFKTAGIIQIISNIILLILYTLKYEQMVAINLLPMYWIVYALCLSVVIQFSLFLVSIYQTNRVYFTVHPIPLQLVKAIFYFALLAYATNVIQFFNYKMDIWILNYFQQSKEGIGIYALAVSLAQMIWLLPSAIQTVLFSSISQQANKQLSYQKSLRSTYFIGLYALITAVIGYFISIYFVPILFGNSFIPSVSIIQILLIGVAPFCLTMSISVYFIGTGQVKINLYAAIIGFITCLVFDLYFIPTKGIQGAAIASVISYISTLMYLLFVFFKQRKME